MSPSAHAEVATTLTEVLTRVGDALAHADLEGLLTAESDLSAIATQLSRLRGLTAEDREAVQPELERARHALARCQCLGQRLQHLTQEVASTRAGAYSRRGVADSTSPSPRVEAKV